MSSPLAHLYDVDLEEDLASIVPPVSDTNPPTGKRSNISPHSDVRARSISQRVVNHAPRN